MHSEAYNYDPAMSHFGGEDWSKENYVVRSSFATLVNRWLSLMAAQDKTLLGISLQTSEPSTGQCQNLLQVRGNL